MECYKTIRFITLYALGVMAGSCLDPYSPHGTTQNLSYLTVDGFLNANDSTCTITLSRTIPLDATTTVPKERFASVQVLSDKDESITLTESFPGTYTGSKIAVDPLSKYQLRIATHDGKTYASDPVPVMLTPPIDSVSWKTSATQFMIYVNTHSPSTEIGYYRWKFRGTWQYHAKYLVSVIEVSPGVTVDNVDTLYYCYQDNDPEGIEIASTARLQENTISGFPLRSFDLSSFLIQIRYSILVEQRSLTEDAYNYYEQLKKTTEGPGTLFDPLPSTVSGNMHNAENSLEPVPGYFIVGSVQTERIFLTRQQVEPISIVEPVSPFDYCVLTPIYFADTAGIRFKPPVSFKFLSIVDPIFNKQGVQIGWDIASEDCVDRRSAGGTLTKPPFW